MAHANALAVHNNKLQQGGQLIVNHIAGSRRVVESEGSVFRQCNRSPAAGGSCRRRETVCAGKQRLDSAQQQGASAHI